MTLVKIINASQKRAKRWLWVFPPKEYTPICASLHLAGILKSLGYDVQYVQQSTDGINYGEIPRPDLVLLPITFTTLAPMAYKIADMYRSMGIPVGLGGIHVWAMPEEAMQHADFIVVGEAEGIMQKVMEDFENRVLQKRYDAPLLDEWRVSPARDILNPKRYMTVNIIQTSRGCPHDCEFCSVTACQGRKMRHRPIDDVIAEAKTLRGNHILFLDDNIFGDVRYSKELLEGLIPHKKIWFGQAPYYVAENKDLMELARQSGCRGLFVGLESLSEASLKGANKEWANVSKYAETIKTFHDYGIYVVAGLMFGFDEDDNTIFDRTVKFALENKVEIANFSIQTPLPGTRLFKRLEEEGRILTYDWSKYDAAHVVYQPKNMTPEELQQGLYRAYEKFYTGRLVLAAIRDPKFLLPVRFAFWDNYRNINKREREVDGVFQNPQLRDFLQKWRDKTESVQCYLATKKKEAHEFIVRKKEGVVERLTVPYEKLQLPLRSKRARNFKSALADRIRLVTNAASVTYL